MSTNKQGKTLNRDVKDIEEAGFKKLNPITDAKEIRDKKKITQAMHDSDKKQEEALMADDEIAEGKRDFKIPGNPKNLGINIRWFDDGHKRVEIKLGEEKTIVKRDDLMTVLFLLATRTQRRKSVTGFVQDIKKYSTIVGIVAQKDIRKGEEITFPITIDLPVNDQGVVMAPDKGKNLSQVV